MKASRVPQCGKHDLVWTKDFIFYVKVFLALKKSPLISPPWNNDKKKKSFWKSLAVRLVRTHLFEFDGLTHGKEVASSNSHSGSSWHLCGFSLPIPKTSTSGSFTALGCEGGWLFVPPCGSFDKLVTCPKCDPAFTPRQPPPLPTSHHHHHQVQAAWQAATVEHPL